jgi:pimeloyl-ACP methyl ester carboxylesterase
VAQREPLRHGPVVTSQAGDGPDLVLIHGLAGSGDWWAHIQPALTTAFRVTTIDPPGFGTSHSEARLILDEVPDQVADLVDAQEGIEKRPGGFVAGALNGTCESCGASTAI